MCRTAVAALSDGDVAFLAAVACDDSESRLADVAERMDVTLNYAQQYRRRMIGAGIIRAPRRGYVAFAVPYLADHLRRAARYDE